jgi:hypothetical protein
MNDTNFPSVTKEIYGNITYNTTTAILGTKNAAGEIPGLRISGLPLGFHTIRFTNNNSGASERLFAPAALDIITPIHINSPDFKTGSLALLDKRKEGEVETVKNKIDLTKTKAWIKWDGINNQILGSYNIAAVVDQGIGNYRIFFKQPFKDNNYAVAGVGQRYATGIGQMNHIGIDRTSPTRYPQASNCVIHCLVSGLSAQNAVISVLFFGELENEEDIDLEDL